MAGIVGVAKPGSERRVRSALDRLAHRGQGGRRVQSLGDVTMGWVWPDVQASFADGGEGIGVALDGEVHNWAELADGAASLAHALQIAYHRDGPGFVAKIDGPFALAIAGPRGLLLARDLVGKSPPTASTGTRSASLRR